jgi:hypothetical protein
LQQIPCEAVGDAAQAVSLKALPATEIDIFICPCEQDSSRSLRRRKNVAIGDQFESSFEFKWLRVVFRILEDNLQIYMAKKRFSHHAAPRTLSRYE